MAEKQHLTKSGYKKLKDELDTLINKTRDEVKAQLAEARSQGDLSENADYDAARNKQAEVEARIVEIQAILDNAVIIDEGKKGNNKVALGSTVTIRYLKDNKEATYKIVGTVESDPFQGFISNACALGEALIGKSVGETVEVKTAKFIYSVEILKVEMK